MDINFRALFNPVRYCFLLLLQEYGLLQQCLPADPELGGHSAWGRGALCEEEVGRTHPEHQGWQQTKEMCWRNLWDCSADGYNRAKGRQLLGIVPGHRQQHRVRRGSGKKKTVSFLPVITGRLLMVLSAWLLLINCWLLVLSHFFPSSWASENARI